MDKRGILFTGAARAPVGLRWKVIATRHEALGLTPAAFIMQRGKKSKLSIRQVRLARLEAIVGLSFGPLTYADFLTRNESLVSKLGDIFFPEAA